MRETNTSNRYHELLEGLGSLAVLALPLVGLPIVQLHFLKLSLAHFNLGVEPVKRLLTQSINGHLLIEILGIAGWIVWIWFAIYSVCALVTAIRCVRAGQHDRTKSLSWIVKLSLKIIIAGLILFGLFSGSGKSYGASPHQVTYGASPHQVLASQSTGAITVSSLEPSSLIAIASSESSKLGIAFGTLIIAALAVFRSRERKYFPLAFSYAFGGDSLLDPPGNLLGTSFWFEHRSTALEQADIGRTRFRVQGSIATHLRSPRQGKGVEAEGGNIQSRNYLQVRYGRASDVLRLLDDYYNSCYEDKNQCEIHRSQLVAIQCSKDGYFTAIERSYKAFGCTCDRESFTSRKLNLSNSVEARGIGDAKSGNPIPPVVLFDTHFEHSDDFVLNLEAIGSITLIADHALISGLMVQMIVDITTFSRTTSILSFGIPSLSFCDEMIVECESIDQLLKRLKVEVQKRYELLRFERLSTSTRQVNNTEWIGPTPLVIFVGTKNVDTNQIGEIINLIEGHRLGISLVLAQEDACDVLSATEASSVILDYKNQEAVFPWASRPTQIRLNRNIIDRTVSLAGHLSEIIGAELPTGCEVERVYISGPRDEGLSTTLSESIPEVQVLVLGPVEILGNSKNFSRQRAFDLVVYLALHPKGVERDIIVNALWNGREVPRQTIDTIVSSARSALGYASNGNHHLPSAWGKLKLEKSVSCDWTIFESLVMRGADVFEDCDDSLRLSNLERAMQLVRGQLFGGLKMADWVLFEGIGSRMESSIVDRALELADIYFSMGSFDQCKWALRQALKVSPYDERVYRKLMKCSYAEGNIGGVVAVMDELQSVIESDIEPFDTIHPATKELFMELCARK